MKRAVLAYLAAGLALYVFVEHEDIAEDRPTSDRRPTPGERATEAAAIILGWPVALGMAAVEVALGER